MNLYFILAESAGASFIVAAEDGPDAQRIVADLATNWQMRPAKRIARHTQEDRGILNAFKMRGPNNTPSTTGATADRNQAYKERKNARKRAKKAAREAAQIVCGYCKESFTPEVLGITICEACTDDVVRDAAIEMGVEDYLDVMGHLPGDS